VNFLILLAVFGALAYRIVPAADRSRYLSGASALFEEVKTAFTTRRPQYEAFKAALRARTPHAVVAPALVALNAAFFCAIVFVALLALLIFLSRAAAQKQNEIPKNQTSEMTDKTVKPTEEELRKKLTPDQYRITQLCGT